MNVKTSGKFCMLPVPEVVVFPKTRTSFNLNFKDNRYAEMLKNAIETKGYVITAMTRVAKSGELHPQSIGVLSSVEQDLTSPNRFVLNGILVVEILYIESTKPDIIVRVTPLEQTDMDFSPVKDAFFEELKSKVLEKIEHEENDAEITISELVNTACLMVPDKANRQFLLETLSIQKRYDILSVLFQGNLQPIDNRFLRKFFNDRMEGVIN